MICARKTSIVLLTVLLLVSACSSPNSQPTQVQESFSFTVRVQTEESLEAINNALVTIEVADSVPLNERTDSSGIAIFSIDDRYADGLARMIIEAGGFETISKSIVLNKGNLPEIVQLSAVQNFAEGTSVLDANIVESTGAPTPTTDSLIDSDTLEETLTSKTVEPEVLATAVSMALSKTAEALPTETLIEETPIPSNTPTITPIPTATPFVILEEFSQPISDIWQQLGGTPGYIDGFLVPQGTEFFWIMIGDETWKNYVIELDVISPECNDSDLDRNGDLVGVRAKDTNNMLAMHYSFCATRWFNWRNGVPIFSEGSKRNGLGSKGEVHRLKIEVIEDTVRAVVDGEHRIELINQEYNSGGLVFRFSYSNVDSIKLTRLDDLSED